MNNHRIAYRIALLCCLLASAGCNGPSRPDDKTAQAGSTDHPEHPSVMGLVFSFRPGEVEAYSSDFPRYLRVRPNANYDLLLDERILIDPSSMSVAVARGRGTAREFGDRTVLCSPESIPGPDQLFYNCATKLPFRGRQVILVWRDWPRFTTEVKRAAEDSSTFLAARLVEDRPNEASLNGAKMRGYKPSVEPELDPPLPGTWSPSRLACPADPWTFIGYDPVRLERTGESCKANAVASGIDGILKYRATCKDKTGEHSELWSLRQRGPILTMQRSRSKSWGGGPISSHRLERCG